LHGGEDGGARTGNIYAGLLYPIVIAAMTLIVGLVFLRETNTTRIYEEIGVAGQAQAEL
jgi:hypothetical protein